MSFISQLARSNIRVTYLIIFLILGLGAVSLQNMAKSEDPQFELAISIVQIFAPGLKPEDIESQIVNPVEESFRLLEQVKSIEAYIKNGVVSFEVKFLYGTDPDDSFDDVVRAVNRLRPELPTGVSYRFVKGAPTTVNVMQIALSSKLVGYRVLEREAKKLQKRIEALELVNRAEVWGQVEQVVQVSVDMAKLNEAKLTLSQVEQALATRGKAQNAGYLDGAQKRYTIALSGKFEQLTQVEQTLLPNPQGVDLRVADIAHVYFSDYKPNYLTYVNDKPSVFITLQQSIGSNIFTVQEQVNQQIDDFITTLDKDIELQVLFDQSESVKQRVGGFLDNLWFGLGLILLSLFLFIGIKEAIAVSLAIPISISVALFIVDLLGLSFQQMTIAGLIISLGLLVDNALVVVEASVRKLSEQKPLAQSITEAVKEVGWPITSGTLTTMLAFLPLLLLQSDTGDFMRAMPTAVSLVLLASLFTALILIPALLLHWQIKPSRRLNLQTMLEYIASDLYRPLLQKLLNFPLLLIIIGLGFAGFFVSFFGQVGVSLFPKAEKNIIVVNVETDVNSSIQYSREVAFELAEELNNMEGVEYIANNIGGNNPRIYYNQITRLGESHFSQLMLFLDSYDSAEVNQKIDQIRAEYKNYAKAKVTVYEFQQGPVTDRPITIRLFDDDLAKLSSKAQSLYQFMQNLAGTDDVQNVSAQVAPELKIEFDQYDLLQAGLSLQEAEQQLTSLVNGRPVASLYDQYGESFAVLVQPDKNDIHHLFNHGELFNKHGQAIALKQVAKLELVRGSAPFYHYQKSRMMKVSADSLPGYSVQQLTAQVIEFLEQQQWQDGSYYLVGGEEAARQESFGGLSQIMLIAFGGIFTILVIQFKSFLQPVIIFSIMPISVTGAIFGLYLTGNSFSMLAFIGMISLIGIVVNDSIIMIDSFNRKLLAGEQKRQAMVQAASSRFTPIIFTSLTTILGLLPLTLFGGPLWQPMGWVIITGLFFSTLTCLFFVPAVGLLLSVKKSTSSI